MKNKNKNPQRRAHIQAQIKKEKRLAKQQEHFTEPLTGKRARHIAHAESGVEFKPVERSIQGEARGSVKREKDLGRMYDQAAGAQTAAIGVAQAGDAAAVKAATDRLAAAGELDAKGLGEAAAANAALAGRLGGPTDTGGQVTAAAGNAARAQQSIALNQPLAEMGSHFATEMGNRVVATRLRGIEASQNERQRRTGIIHDLQAAKKQRGQATVKHLHELRTEDRENAVDKEVARLNAQKAAVSQRQGAARIAVSKEGNAISEQNARTAEKNAESSRISANASKHNAHKPSSSNGLTPSQKRAAKHDRQSATAAAKQWYGSYVSAGKAPKSQAEWAAFTALIKKETGADYNVVKAAVDKVRGQAHRKAVIKGAAGKVPSF